MAAACLWFGAGCAELAAVGAVALQGALSAPPEEEKAAREPAAWTAAAGTLTPARKQAVGYRLEGGGPAWQAWMQWKKGGRVVESGDFPPEVHAEVSRAIEEVRATKVQPCWRWNPPDLERRWQRRLAETAEPSTAPRTEGADGARGEALLARFAAPRMPRSLARYREARRKAAELVRVLEEEFPQGASSDPSGGEIHERTRADALRAVGEMFRRHDELCFFFLLRKAGVFSDKALKERDGRGGAAWLDATPLPSGEDAPGALPVPGEEDAAFAREFLPESEAACRALEELHARGVAQYRDLGTTARLLDAVRAGGTLALFRNRLETIRAGLEEAYRQAGICRFRHRIGELDAAALREADRRRGAALRALREETGLAKWVARTAKAGVLVLPGGETMDMVWCPAGTFERESPGSGTGGGAAGKGRETAIAEGFWMARTEVTLAQFLSVLSAGQDGDASALAGELGETAADLPATEGTVPDFPKLSERFLEASLLELPTPDEWEYACRAGSAGPFAGTGNPADMGWTAENAGGKLHPAGRKMPNAWGLCDMHGNAWERCAGEGGPVCGGSVLDRAEDCRSSSRVSLAQGLREKVERDMETMFRRLREEGIDETDLARGIEWLPPRKREKLRRLAEEGVIPDPERMAEELTANVGFRPVFRP